MPIIFNIFLISNKEIKEKGYDFVNAGAVHIEPMGLYSKKIKDIADLKDGATVITSNSESDWGRIITILQNAGLVKVKDGVDLETATFDDIAENPKNLKFNHSIDPSLLASTYQNDEGDLVAINANFAYGAGLNPLKDSVLLEEDNSPYVNIIATRKGDENSEKSKNYLKSYTVKTFKNGSKTNGAVQSNLSQLMPNKHFKKIELNKIKCSSKK